MLSFHQANFPNVTFQYDFGDGISTLYQSSAVYNYLYTSSGYSTLTVKAKTSTSATVTASQVQQVLTPPSGIYFDTPLVFETTVDVSYAVVVREGANMTIVVESVATSPSLPLEGEQNNIALLMKRYARNVLSLYSRLYVLSMIKIFVFI